MHRHGVALHGHHHLVPPPVEQRGHGFAREHGADEGGSRRPGLEFQAFLRAVHGQGELGAEGTAPRSGTSSWLSPEVSRPIPGIYLRVSLPVGDLEEVPVLPGAVLLQQQGEDHGEGGGQPPGKHLSVGTVLGWLWDALGMAPRLVARARPHSTQNLTAPQNLTSPQNPRAPQNLAAPQNPRAPQNPQHPKPHSTTISTEPKTPQHPKTPYHPNPTAP